MRVVGTLTGIHRYPVKSMQGEQLDTVEITPAGLSGDRCWAVRDEVRGGMRGAKRFPELLNCSARLLESATAGKPSPAVEITLPDGEMIRTDSALVHERLSKALAAPVQLFPLVTATDLAHYRRVNDPTDLDPAEATRAAFARLPEEPLPDLSVFPAELFEYSSPPGTYFDAYPVLILSTRAMATMQAAAPDSIMNTHRFRPNLVVDLPGDRFPEDDLVGRRLRIGTAEFNLKVACPRCVMTTMAQWITPVGSTLPKDTRIMRALVAQNRGNLGVYAEVVKPGTARCGDEISVSD